MGALAYFITWTCYGTRVHGDERGSVDDTHNRYGTPYLPADAQYEGEIRDELKESPWEMTEADRENVERAIRTTSEIRRWRIIKLNVRTNHVHIVIQASDHPPERIAGDLKSWATRSLKTSGRHANRTKFWTNQASTRHLFDDFAVTNAIAYVINQ